MSPNHIFLVVLFISVIGSLLLHIASIKWGLRWTNIAYISLVKAFGIFVLIVLAQIAAAVLLGIALVIAKVHLNDIAEGSINIGLQFVAASTVVALIYKVPAARGAKAAMPLLLTSVSLVLLAIFVIRPFTYEAFVVPTNGMAPTLLGNHLEAPCPNCGSPAYGAPPDPQQPASPDGLQMICSNEMKTVNVKITPTATEEGDKILVSKLVTPKRWDSIVFRSPPDPSVNYVKRLIGMPGEKVEIRDGAVWINDEKMEPPESIRKIHYSPTIETHGQVVSGPGSIPVTLGSDEYFVLGDFVDQSSDSRFWEKGMPGHPPYAVPASSIVGVVINIYWPPNRWTSFR